MRRLAVFAFALVALAGFAAAEGLSFDFIGPRFNFALLSPLPIPTGADVEFRYGLADLGPGPLQASLRVAGGYEDKRVLRDATTGDPLAAPTGKIGEAGGEQRYQSPNFQWDLGLVQGLASKGKDNLVEAFLLYRGRYDSYVTSLSTAKFADMQGLFGASFILGAAYDSTESDSRRVKSGVKAEASGEWGPGALNSGFGPTDFHRLNLKAAGFHPLFSFGQAGNPELNLFSAYLAGFASFDYAGGEAIPVYVRQSFGGRVLRNSLGSCVRGYPSQSYDAALKTVANGELRLVGPALFNTPWLVPIVYGFCDAGYYAGFPEAATKADASGTILSAGGGFALDVLDFAYIGVSLGAKFPGSDALYAVYGETDTFFFSVEFLLHF